MGINKGIKKVFWWMLVIFAILFFLLFVVYDKEMVTAQKFNCSTLDAEWNVTVDGTTVFYEKLPVSIKTSKDNTIWISRKIGKVTNETNAVGLFSFQKEVHAWIDGKEVLSFTNKSKIKSKMPGNSWLFVNLQPEDEGKILTIQLHQCYGNGQVMLPVLYSGTTDGIMNTYLKQKIPMICLSAIGAAVGVVLVLLWFLVGKSLMLNEGLPWLGVFAIGRGIWSILEANIYSFYAENILFWVWISYMCLKLIVIPFALFDDFTFFDGKSKFLKVLMGISLVDTMVTTLLQIFGIADFADTVALTNVLILVLCIYAIGSGIGNWIKMHKNPDLGINQERRTTYSINTIFMFVLVVTSIIDVYRFYFTNSPDIALYSRAGYFIYVIAIVTAILWDFARLVTIGRHAEYIQQEAYMDSMTKLYNRTFFEGYIDSFSDNKCQGKEVLMFDLNNLKQFNDQMGHDMGDYYIKVCSELIRDLYGSYGKIMRIGGDEFCGIVEHLGRNHFENIKKQMEERVRALQIPDCEMKMNIAVGYGKFDESTDQTLRDTMKRADEEMYENKMELKGRK